MSPRMFGEIVNTYAEYSRVLTAGNVKSKPLFGPEFGAGKFEIASTPDTRSGLWIVHYFVLHTASGMVYGSGESQSEALSVARHAIKWLGIQEVAVREAVAARRAEVELAAKDSWLERCLISFKKPFQAIPKRRQAIFDKSEGKCHYCATPLTIDGKWHIEHKMPRALLGGSEQSNLVAACVSCNLRKKDKTDLEFIANEAELARAKGYGA